jgi:hypothetical protein
MPQRIDAVRLSSFRQLPSRRIALAQQSPPQKQQLPRVAQALIDALTPSGNF